MINYIAISIVYEFAVLFYSEWRAKLPPFENKTTNNIGTWVWR
jgi:hypothetical protein